jgi:hypothetical protein
MEGPVLPWEQVSGIFPISSERGLIWGPLGMILDVLRAVGSTVSELTPRSPVGASETRPTAADPGHRWGAHSSVLYLGLQLSSHNDLLGTLPCPSSWMNTGLAHRDTSSFLRL